MNMVLQEQLNRIKEVMNLISESKCEFCDKRTIDNINKLSTKIQPIAKTFIDNVKSEKGIDLVITDGFRSIDDQDKIYCKGRPQDEFCFNKKYPTDGKITTQVKGGDSSHNYGNAFDVYIKVNGVVDVNKPITPEIAEIGKKLGLEWGGDWTNFNDKPHFQLPNPVPMNDKENNFKMDTKFPYFDL